MGILNALFGSSTDTAKVRQMLEAGAIVIDVRTPSEFNNGHVPNSKNIPLQEIHSKMGAIKKMGKPVVFCCATGNRSGQATTLLSDQGVECENGGGWKQVNKLI